MLLKTGQCFTNELELNANQVVIAEVFNDCNGDPHAPGAQLAKCSDIPAAPVLQLAGQVLSLSTGGSVTLPDQDTDAQALSISGNVISLTNGGSVTLPTTAAPVPQVLSLAGNTVTLSGGGGSVTIPDLDTQDLSISGNVISLTNGGSITLPAAAVQDPYATPAQTVAGTATALIVNPADLYARENIPAQTGLSNDVTAIPAPAANQSPWGVNQLGETLHYAPGLGWRIVANLTQAEATAPVGNLPAGTVHTLVTLVAPRAGKISLHGYSASYVDNADPNHTIVACHVRKNGAVVGLNGATMLRDNTLATGTGNRLYQAYGASGVTTVAAGDTLTFTLVSTISAFTSSGENAKLAYQYEA